MRFRSNNSQEAAAAMRPESDYSAAVEATKTFMVSTTVRGIRIPSIPPNDCLCRQWQVHLNQMNFILCPDKNVADTLTKPLVHVIFETSPTCWVPKISVIDQMIVLGFALVSLREKSMKIVV
jgi:hypothetical protein